MNQLFVQEPLCVTKGSFILERDPQLPEGYMICCGGISLNLQMISYDHH